MIYIAAHFLLALLTELPIMRATYKVLRMRSTRLFVIVHLVLYCLGFSFRYLPLSKTVGGALSLIISIMMLLVLPFALSVGSIRHRLSRICLVCLGAAITEYVGGSTYSFISGGSLFPSEINRETIGSVVIIFSLLIVLSISVNEILIALCARFDRESDAAIEPPAIILPLFTYLSLNLLYVRCDIHELHESIVPLLALTCSIATLAICAALIIVARQEAEAARKSMDNAAIARQEHHVRGEIEASVRRTKGMSRLRHDLANQVEVVEQLANQGNYAEADRYSALLQTQARALIGDDHE